MVEKSARIEDLHPRSLRHLSSSLLGLVRGRLWAMVLLGLVLGTGVGIALGPSAGWLDPDTALTVSAWLAMPGHVFLGLIQMIVVPLVFASIIRGLAASENLEQLRKVGLWAVGFFLVTTVVGVVVGIVLALVVQPGAFVDAEAIQASLAGVPQSDLAPEAGARGSLPEQIVRILPTNPLGSMVEREMLQVVLFAIFVGLALVSLQPKQARPLLELLGTLQEVALTVVRWAMWLAPFAVFGLMTQLTSRIGLDALLGMSVYVGTVLAGLLVLLVLYVVIAVVGAKQRAGTFVRGMRELQLLAFSTSSSAAVMPLSMKTAVEKLGVRPSVAQFVIPLGATVNMNGTALYQGVATVFLAQVFGVDLDIADLVLVVVTAVAASIGSPAAPGVGIVILAMVLGSVGIPAAGLGLILGVDRLLDMCRTAVNVTGDVVAAAVVDRVVGGVASVEEQLEESERREAKRAATGADVILGSRA